MNSEDIVTIVNNLDTIHDRISEKGLEGLEMTPTEFAKWLDEISFLAQEIKKEIPKPTPQLRIVNKEA